MKNKMHLSLLPFELISKGKQKIEARLCDPKRSQLKIGDIIEFLSTDDSQSFQARIVDLLKFKTFEELFRSRPCADFGGDDVNELVSAARKYYSLENELKYGVLGIELQLLN